MMHSCILYAEHALRNPVPHSPSHWRASGILQYQLYGVKSPEQSPLATVSKYLPGILNHMCASIPSVMLLMPQVYSNSSAPLAWEVYDDRSDPGSKEASTDSTDHSSKDCMPCNSHRSSNHPSNHGSLHIAVLSHSMKCHLSQLNCVLLFWQLPNTTLILMLPR